MKLKLLFPGLIVLGFLAVSNCRSSENKDCSQFKSGNFEYRSNGLRFAIIRKDTLQTETNTANGAVTNISIRWITDCSYQMRMKYNTEIYPDSVRELREASVITTEILSWTDEYYIYKAGSDLVGHVMTDTLWIVK